MDGLALCLLTCAGVAFYVLTSRASVVIGLSRSAFGHAPTFKRAS